MFGREQGNRVEYMKWRLSGKLSTEENKVLVSGILFSMFFFFLFFKSHGAAKGILRRVLTAIQALTGA